MNTDLIKSLERAHVAFVRSPIKRTNVILKNPNFQKAMELWQAYIASYEEIDLFQSVPDSSVAAEFVNLYPPGIPLLVPGEIIDKNILEVIEQYLKNGYNVQGIENNKIKVVRLPKEGERYEEN